LIEHAPELKHEMTYRFHVSGPLAATEDSPTGPREYWEMTEGALTGARIKARIALPDGDWMLVSADRVARPDVRVQFITEDGSIVSCEAPLHARTLFATVYELRPAALPREWTQPIWSTLGTSRTVYC
jgi:hypothetical protein